MLTALALGFLRMCEDANEADWGHVWLNRLDGFNRLFCRYYHGLRHNRTKFQARGPGIVVANHISGLDPMLIIASSPRPLRFLIASEQYYRFGLNWLFRAIGCIPVDREKNPERAMRDAIKALKQGEIVALFPQGGISLDPEKKNKLKAGAVRLAKFVNCALYPIKIKGIHKWAQGRTLWSVLIPSRVEIECLDPVSCAELDEGACLELIRSQIMPADSKLENAARHPNLFN